MNTWLLIAEKGKRSLLGLALTVLFCQHQAEAGQLPVDLRSADSFAILAGTAVTSTGGGTINGNVGVWTGTSFVVGEPPVIVNGKVYLGVPIAKQAQADLTTAYNDAAGRTTDVVILPDEQLGSKTLAPGLYTTTSGWLQITGGDLTLDAGGDPNAVWIFQMATSLKVGNGYGVILSGGAQARNVFWQVGSSATLGTTSRLKGNILAFTAIWISTGATLDGRALARNAEVTLDSNALALPPRRFIDLPWRILLMNKESEKTP
jgi:hypothetical protein